MWSIFPLVFKEICDIISIDKNIILAKKQKTLDIIKTIVYN